VLVEQLWWWRSGEGKLVSIMATAALGAEAAAAAGEEGSRGNGNGECSHRGRVLGVLTACWPIFAALGRAPMMHGQPLAPRGGSVLIPVGH